MVENWDRVNRGFDLLLPVLLRYELNELENAYGREAWWTEGIEPILSPEQRRNIGHLSDDSERIASMLLLFGCLMSDGRMYLEKDWPAIAGRGQTS